MWKEKKKKNKDEERRKGEYKVCIKMKKGREENR